MVGGPGAFVIAMEEFENFGVAVRRKLVREISDPPPPPRRTARRTGAGAPGRLGADPEDEGR